MPSIQEDVVPFEFVDLDTRNLAQPNRRSLPPNFFGNADFAMPMHGNDWQTQTGPFDNTSSKSKSAEGSAGDTVDNMWQLPIFPAVTDSQNRMFNGLSNVSSARQAQADSSGSDALRSLFPGMDFRSRCLLIQFRLLVRSHREIIAQPLHVE